MSGFKQDTTTRLFSTADTWGSADIVAASDRVVLDIETRNYNTTGHLCRDHALACLSLASAERLRDLLSEAIAVATYMAPHAHQTALWSGMAGGPDWRPTRSRRAI